MLDSLQIDGLVQKRCNSMANALELCLFCTNPLKYDTHIVQGVTLHFIDFLDVIIASELFKKFWISQCFMTEFTAWDYSLF